MSDRDYSHRDVVDKLGVKSGQVVAFVDEAGPLDEDLRQRVLARTGRPAAAEREVADLVLVAAIVLVGGELRHSSSAAQAAHSLQISCEPFWLASWLRW